MLFIIVNLRIIRHPVMELTKCINCNSSHLKVMDRYKHAFLVKCNDCGLVFGKKNPSAAELTAHYTNYPRYNSI